MTTQYFRNFTSTNEQELLQSITNEVIDMYGAEVMYVPRLQLNTDDVMVDDKLSSFYNAYPITAFIKNIEGFGGQGSFLTQFGLEIRDQITFTVSRNRFFDNVAARDSLFRNNRTYMGRPVSRPREGDLIYLPINQKLYSIRYVASEVQFYPTGALLSFDLTCETFNYNNETYNTGVPEIDAIFDSVNANQQVSTGGGAPDEFLSADGSYYIESGDDSNSIVSTVNSPFNNTPADKSQDVMNENAVNENFQDVDPFGDSKGNA